MNSVPELKFKFIYPFTRSHCLWYFACMVGKKLRDKEEQMMETVLVAYGNGGLVDVYNLCTGEILFCSVVQFRNAYA